MGSRQQSWDPLFCLLLYFTHYLTLLSGGLVWLHSWSGEDLCLLADQAPLPEFLLEYSLGLLRAGLQHWHPF